LTRSVKKAAMKRPESLVESGVRVIFKKLLFITSVSHVGDESGAL
jgi:hypothetical protein